MKAVKNSKIVEFVKNVAFLTYEKSISSKLVSETIDAGPAGKVLSEIRQRWEINIDEELSSMSKEAKMPLSRQRSRNIVAQQTDDKHDAHNPHGEESTTLRFLFDVDDMIEFVIAGTSYNGLCHPWGVIDIEMNTPSFTRLQNLYSDLGYWNEQVESHHNTFRSYKSSFLTKYTEDGLEILDMHSISSARKYARRGIPRCLRPEMYRLLLGLSRHTTEQETAEYHQLLEQVEQYVTFSFTAPLKCLL